MMPAPPKTPVVPDPVFRMQNHIFFVVLVITGSAIIVGLVLQWPIWVWLPMHGFAIGMAIANVLISSARLKEARLKAEQALDQFEAMLDKRIEGLDGFLKSLTGSQKDTAKQMGWDEEWFKP